jgi:hypothetical protein
MLPLGLTGSDPCMQHMSMYCYRKQRVKDSYSVKIEMYCHENKRASKCSSLAHLHLKGLLRSRSKWVIMKCSKKDCTEAAIPLVKFAVLVAFSNLSSFLQADMHTICTMSENLLK